MNNDAHEIGLCGGDHADGLVLREIRLVFGGENRGEIGEVLDCLACLEEVLVRFFRDIVRVVVLSGGYSEGEEAEGGEAAEDGGGEREARRRAVAEDGNGGDRHVVVGGGFDRERS